MFSPVNVEVLVDRDDTNDDASLVSFSHSISQFNFASFPKDGPVSPAAEMNVSTSCVDLPARNAVSFVVLEEVASSVVVAVFVSAWETSVKKPWKTLKPVVCSFIILSPFTFRVTLSPFDFLSSVFVVFISTAASPTSPDKETSATSTAVVLFSSPMFSST